MIKSSITQSPDRKDKEKELLRKNQRIKELTTHIEQSRTRQSALLRAISEEQAQIEQRQNALASAQNCSLVDLDIRNSQLVSSVQLQRKRWLSERPRHDGGIVGEEQELRQQLGKVKNEEKPMEKAKMLKMMKRKSELLQGLSKVRAESGLSVSHQRVLLKQYLEDMRAMNGELEQSNKRFAKLQLQFQEAQRKLRNTVNDLRQVLPIKPIKEE